jgi:hypothetical protein
MKTEPKINFQGTKAKRDFFAGEELVAYDVGQLLGWERSFARHQFLTRGTGDGLPPVSVLVACWRRARDSWARVTAALPPGKLRNSMLDELRERDAAMDQLCEKAKAQLYAKVVEGEVEGAT